MSWQRLRIGNADEMIWLLAAEKLGQLRRLNEGLEGRARIALAHKLDLIPRGLRQRTGDGREDSSDDAGRIDDQDSIGALGKVGKTHLGEAWGVMAIWGKG